MPEVIFWMSFIFVLYVYAGYPLLLALWRRIAPKPIRKGDWEPMVSILIAARNERERIGWKIRNCLALEYPAEKREIIISVDGSSDGTEESARECESDAVKVIAWSRHMGKAVALNRAMAAARGEVMVFADARQRLSPSALRELVANLHDPAVGAVSGELILHDPQQAPEADQAGDAAGMYWRYEKWIRTMESQIGSVAGATGALYAMRREFVAPMPEGTILDDVWLPLRSVLLGKRVVLEPCARAYDTTACCSQKECQRKIRTLYGNYQLLQLIPALLLPWKNPIYWQFLSHKVARLMVPYALVTMFVSNIFLLQGFYAALFGMQLGGYSLAAAGWLAVHHQCANCSPGQIQGPKWFQQVLRRGSRLGRALLLPHGFVVMNCAAVIALYTYLGRSNSTEKELWSKPSPGSRPLSRDLAAEPGLAKVTGQNES